MPRKDELQSHGIPCGHSNQALTYYTQAVRKLPLVMSRVWNNYVQVSVACSDTEKFPTQKSDLGGTVATAVLHLCSSLSFCMLLSATPMLSYDLGCGYHSGKQKNSSLFQHSFGE